MRRFGAEYLRRTRRGMWDDSREALAGLDLPNRDRILDVGCGTGELTRVLAEESRGGGRDPTIVGVDADPGLLEVAADETGLPTLAGDATRLPFPDDAFDLVVCQALLINLPAPAAAVREFERVSSELVAAVEPNNAQVGVESTLDREVELERRVRETYLRGVGTNVALGDRVGELFRRAGVRDVSTRRYYHEKRTEPPYSRAALEGATRKATGAGLADHESELRRGLDAADADATYDDLRRDWRAMGRDVIEQMRAGDYERVELVPFDVTVGRVESPPE